MCQIADLPAGLVQRPRFGPAFCQQQGQRQVDLRRREIGVDGQGLAGMRFGLVQAAGFAQQDAQVAVRGQRVRPGGQGLAVGGFGRVQMSDRVQGDRQIGQSIDVVGAQAQRGPEAILRLGHPPQLVMHHPQVVVGIGEVGVQAQRLALATLRLAEFLQGDPGQAEVGPGRGEIRLQTDGLAVMGGGFLDLAGAMQFVAALMIGFRGGGVVRCHR